MSFFQPIWSGFQTSLSFYWFSSIDPLLLLKLYHFIIQHSSLLLIQLFSTLILHFLLFKKSLKALTNFIPFDSIFYWPQTETVMLHRQQYTWWVIWKWCWYWITSFCQIVPFCWVLNRDLFNNGRIKLASIYNTEMTLSELLGCKLINFHNINPLTVLIDYLNNIL